MEAIQILLYEELFFHSIIPKNLVLHKFFQFSFLLALIMKSLNHLCIQIGLNCYITDVTND